MAHRVLLVEDDAELREAMQTFLRSEGYDVCCAHDGAEALRVLWRGFQPCVILLDLMLPRFDGFTFDEYHRANPAWKDIPIIVLSGMDNLPQRLRDLRPAAWFKKPVDLDALGTVIARYRS